MSNPPAFQFYASDFRADPKVLTMDFEQRGVYIWLLTIAWDDDGIPADTGTLARLCGLSKRKFEALWQGIENCWVRAGDKFVNPRMERVRSEQRAHADARSQAGKAGAAARWGQTDAAATA